MLVGVHRRYINPLPGDTLTSLAARELPGVVGGDQQLLSWNMHLAMRVFPVGKPGEVLPSDIIYLEPPLAPTA